MSTKIRETRIRNGHGMPFSFFAGIGYVFIDMGVTQKDIAEALQVSLITVHRALNGSGYVSRELKERILAYARDVRYVPTRPPRYYCVTRSARSRYSRRPSALFLERHPDRDWDRRGTDTGLNYQVNYRT